MMKARADALKEQEVKLAAMLADLQMAKAKEVRGLTIISPSCCFINPFTACTTYIKSLLLFACMAYMYVMYVSKAVAFVLDPIYDI